MTRRTYEAYTPGSVKITGWRKDALEKKERCAAKWTEEHPNKQACQGCPDLEECRRDFDKWINE